MVTAGAGEGLPCDTRKQPKRRSVTIGGIALLQLLTLMGRTKAVT